jgi:hypothetical protein
MDLPKEAGMQILLEFRRTSAEHKKDLQNPYHEISIIAYRRGSFESQCGTDQEF